MRSASDATDAQAGGSPRDVFRLTTAEDLQSLVADRLDLTEAATLSANAASTNADVSL